MKIISKSPATDIPKRDLVIHNLSVKEYKAILKFCKKKKINHTTAVYDEEGFCVYLNAVAGESIIVEAELYEKQKEKQNENN